MNTPLLVDLPGDAYWVIPGKLLAGPHPAATDVPLNHFIGYLQQHGVSLIINLTAASEAMDYAVALNGKAQHVRYPIVDGTTPSKDQMVAILDAIDQALSQGKVVYVHCLAGLGRTGTVVGCCLARHGIDGDSALEQISWLRRNTVSSWTQSPETPAQRRYVEKWPFGQ